ncbi:MAG: hypothetical protein ABJN69_08900 [Hellea sp.]
METENSRQVTVKCLARPIHPTPPESIKVRAATLFNYAALALIAGALLHVVGLLMGPEAVKFLGAPPDVVQSIADKTLYGPTLTLAIAALLGGLAVLSLKAKKTRNKIIRAILWLFAFIFTLRGLLIFLFVPAIMAGRNGGDAKLFWFHVGASFFVLTIGIALGWALLKTRKAVS